MKSNNFSLESSRLVSVPALVIFLSGAAVAAAFELWLPSGALLFLAFLVIVSRLWANHSADQIEISVSCEKSAMFPGDETAFTYRIKNNKLLPLVWLELSQNVPRHNCLEPLEDFDCYTCHAVSKDGNNITFEAFRRSFSFISGFEELKVKSNWRALSRGIYVPDKLVCRSGDGFGLAQKELLLPPELLPEITVYPKLVPVDVSSFLSYSWEQRGSSTGFLEDITVVRGLKPYQPTDNWKRINWRMEARGSEELLVNNYETVRPGMLFFVLDGESFGDIENGSGLLEATIEIIASLIADLSSRGISCGAALPEGEDSDGVIISPAADSSLELVLSSLAAYFPRFEYETSEDGTRTGRLLPSRFNLEALAVASSASGSVYLFAARPGTVSEELILAVGGRELTIYAYEDGFAPVPDVKVRNARLLTKGGPA